MFGSELDACKDYKNREERAINLKFEGTFSFKDIKKNLILLTELKNKNKKS